MALLLAPEIHVSGYPNARFRPSSTPPAHLGPWEAPGWLRPDGVRAEGLLECRPRWQCSESSRSACTRAQTCAGQQSCHDGADVRPFGAWLGCCRLCVAGSSLCQVPLDGPARSHHHERRRPTPAPGPRRLLGPAAGAGQRGGPESCSAGRPGGGQQRGAQRQTCGGGRPEGSRVSPRRGGALSFTPGAGNVPSWQLFERHSSLLRRASLKGRLLRPGHARPAPPHHPCAPRREPGALARHPVVLGRSPNKQQPSL